MSLPHVPASSQVKTADNPAPIVLPTVDEVADVLLILLVPLHHLAGAVR